MCGIFALLNNTTRFSGQHVREAFMVGKNRGPEDYHISSFDEKLVLGFHRLAINGLDATSMQPITIGSCTLICNGEIYNYKELFKYLQIIPKTESDCEIIIHLYIKYGIEHTLTLLDGVFAFVLYDNKELETPPVIHIARDPFGVRPLCMMQRASYDEDDGETLFAISSDVKVLSHLLHAEHEADDDSQEELMFSTQNKQYVKNNLRTDEYQVKHIAPGTFQTFTRSFKIRSQWRQIGQATPYYTAGYTKDTYRNSDIFNFSEQNIAWKGICYQLNQAVKKRVIGTTERPIACLLSGGLDSSLITAMVNKYYDGVLETYSIGMKGSEDLLRAKEVADYLGTKHTSIELTKEQFFDAIPYVIYSIESYDTTTVRASVGNYLVGKYISEHSNAKVIFNGDGSDELTGGYLYFLSATDDLDFDFECRRLLKNISTFDVLRSDKCISSHGLEPRTPFLDKQLVDYYLSLPASLRNPLSHFHNAAGTIPCEKLLLRQAINAIEPDLLPKHILWRTKEAFSDGVSGDDGSWFQIIDNMIEKMANCDDTINPFTSTHNLPRTREQLYYRQLFDSYYPNMATLIPYFWMPRFVDAEDSSARTLAVYQTKVLEKTTQSNHSEKNGDIIII
jgi:asparagine synthase (glutamine-hydrolysing)